MKNNYVNTYTYMSLSFNNVLLFKSIPFFWDFVRTMVFFFVLGQKTYKRKCSRKIKLSISCTSFLLSFLKLFKLLINNLICFIPFCEDLKWGFTIWNPLNTCLIFFALVSFLSWPLTFSEISPRSRGYKISFKKLSEISETSNR